MPQMTKEEITNRHNGRKLIKFFLAKKTQLPTSFDNCLAYITGYTNSTIPELKSAKELIALTEKCTDYCQYLTDKESLQLVMYAFRRRLPISRGLSIADTFVSLLDNMLLDPFNIYSEQQKLQTDDLATLFKAFLVFLKSEEYYLKKLFFASADKKRNVYKDFDINTRGGANEATEEEGVCAYHVKWESDIKPDEMVKISRGGGLYNLVDLRKKLHFFVPRDDSGSLRGMYVTPYAKGERSEYYAYRHDNARRFLDKPSTQEGEIAAKYLQSTNHNAYVAFVEVQNIPKIKKLTITELPSCGAEKIDLLSNSFEQIQPYLDLNATLFISRLKEIIARAQFTSSSIPEPLKPSLK